RGLLRPEGHQDPGRGERLSGRALPGPAQLGGEGVPETHPLQQARQGRALCGLGAARVVNRSDARGLSIVAQTDVTSKAMSITCSPLLPPTKQPFAIRRHYEYSQSDRRY